jgi:hypothetical protein
MGRTIDQWAGSQDGRASAVPLCGAPACPLGISGHYGGDR